MLIEGVKIATSPLRCKRERERIGNRMHSGERAGEELRQNERALRGWCGFISLCFHSRGAG
jgi:hypothetical protein